jgi:serine/threonine-protein kinase
VSAPTHDHDQDQLFAALRRALHPQYRLEGELGRGGMGVVYLAVDAALERRVAVKVVHPDLAAHESIARRFLAEARLIARLRHPNIVTVHAAGSAEGLLWYAMDEVPGETLRERLLRDGALPTADAARILADLASALDAAGRAGVVHRDVKPENVLLDATTGRALLVDFGIARAMLGGDGAGPTTGQGVAIGTPAYMSPEQAAGEEIDHRSDLYALGVVGYELLAGHPPFEGPGRVIVSKHLAERPAPLEKARPDCPPALAAAVMRALEKVPAERWQTGEELRQAIVGERAVPQSRRVRRRRLTAALLAATLVVGGGAAVLAARRAPGPPDGVNPRHSILVLPFRNVRDAADVAWLGDASVSMLGLNLSQWDDLTVVDQERVHDLLAGRELHDGREIGLETARRLAREAGVWTVVVGDFERAGDSLYLAARVYDVATGTRLETARAAGLAAADVRPLFDELAARLLDLSGAPSGTATGLAEATTSSLAAFRQYLTGLEHLNHWDLAAAERAFRAATATDSSFGLAYYRLALTRGWLVGAEDSVATEAMNRASASVDRLPPHDRTLLTAYRAFVHGDYGTARGLYGELIARDSADADAWYGLGEAWYHDGEQEQGIASRWTSAIRAFRRTLALDAGYALAYEHVDDMLATAGRRSGIALVAPDSFALVGYSGSAGDGATYAAATARARRDALALARAWVAAQPTTARAHGALVDAHLAAADYDGARAELERFAQVVPDHVQRPFVEARIRFAAGQVDAAATGLRAALDSISSRDFRRNADRPTVVEDVAAAANVFAYQGDLASAKRALLLADEVRREIGPELRPGGDATPAEHWHRKIVGELYAAVGADAGTLRRVWAGAAEASRSSPPEQRKEVAFTGATAAIGLLAESGDASAVEELRALTGDSLPREVRALLALGRGDSSAARRIMRDEDPAAKMMHPYLVFHRPLSAQVHAELGEYERALALLADFEPENLPVRGFDPRWGYLGRVRLLRAWAHERLGHRDAALAEYRSVVEQWRTASDPELKPLVERAMRGMARVSGVG